MKQSIAHVALVVRDYDEAIAFFTQKLRFTLVEDTYIPEQDKRWVLVAPPGSTGTSLLLARPSQPGQEAYVGNQTGGRVTFFLRTDDLRRDYANMIEQGIEFVRPPTEAAYGTVAVFKDLYGNLWDLVEPSQPDARRELATTEIVAQLHALGVQQGGVLLVHTSFRAVRPVEDGPSGLIRALREAIGPDGTLVMPSWNDDNRVLFDRATTPAAADLGIVADTFWREPGVVRTEHPFAFAAAGPLAEHITSDPLPVPPHIPESPVGRVFELDGQVLLLGVGHDADTTLHLAEILGGAPYRVPKSCTVLEHGEAVRMEYGENDHCCVRFALADDWLRAGALQAEGQVGHAQSRLARSRDIVSVAVDQLNRDPLVFLHPVVAACSDCDEARASVRARPGKTR